MTKASDLVKTAELLEAASEHPALVSLVETLQNDLANSDGNLELMQEQLAELELALEDVGWLRMSAFGDREFSIPALQKLRRLARLSYLKNPLIKHAVDVQADYVWGQGCSLTAGSDEVNDVIQRFIDDPKNTVSLTGHAARLDRDRELTVHGDLFFPMFTNPQTGRVVVRSVYPDEIQEIICNPDDYMEPWFYKRVWTEQAWDDSSGSGSSESKTAYYPDWRMVYNKDPNCPKPETIRGEKVMWNAPMYHIKTGGFGDQKFGVPEIYSALDWARAVKEDLENYATQKAALARFAWKQTVKGGKLGVAAAKTKLGSTLDADGAGFRETNPPPTTGATAINAEGWDLNPIKIAGATIPPEEGHRMWLMVAAGTGLPETILTGNADSGNLATAKTLDRPTELKMENRRTLWADIYTDILNYVIDMAALAPTGELDGEMVTDTYGEMATVELAGEIDRSIKVQFPSILERDAVERVNAIVQAATLGNPSAGNAGLLDDQFITGELLAALGQEEIDESLAEIYPDNEITFKAGRGLNNEDEMLPAEYTQSAMSDTGDMSDGLPPDPAPPPRDEGTELGLIAAMRNFQESMKPLYEGSGVDMPALPLVGNRTQRIRSREAIRTSRSGFSLRVPRKKAPAATKSTPDPVSVVEPPAA